MRGSLKAYKSVALDSQKTIATPYQVVKMLLAGALERLAKARVAIEQENFTERGELLSTTLMILAELRLALDHEAGGEIADNLEGLYEFMMNELVKANSENDIERLEVVSGLLREIKDSWDAIPVEFQS
ncbi:flagellar export chaperone FliS [Zobellella iuensis]|uniref:Flagellar secretion chaperone FliS n=1 Tax=Zobellella iuensis TaxID=2803811 RepID=A0ABS1QU51_9GAMM|nr:flagellar export chaperone FliS [Zobellella iuensis]MBL1378405.1 flagellar export chaperone FliS [Zobellella iuensis]